MARSNLTEEEKNNRFIQQMVVSTDQVKSVPSGSRNYELTGRKWYEYRSVAPDPNGSKYLGVPYLSPPSLTIPQIFDMLMAIYGDSNRSLPEGIEIALLDEINDPAISGKQIIFDGYQFLTPRDINMIDRGLFATLSFLNKLIELFREPVSGVLSENRI